VVLNVLLHISHRYVRSAIQVTCCLSTVSCCLKCPLEAACYKKKKMGITLLSSQEVAKGMKLKYMAG
jgi:hypothetical protein